MFVYQIAILFLLQRLKGSMSGDLRDFNIETRTVIRFSSWKARRQRKFTPYWQTFGEHAPPFATVKNRVAQFQHGNFSTCDAPRPGWLKTATTPEIEHIHELILEGRRILDKSIAEQLGISCEQVGSIIHEDLEMWKLSKKCVPKCLNVDQKCQRCQSEQLLEFLWRDPNDFPSWLVTMFISLWPGDKATINGDAA